MSSDFQDRLEEMLGNVAQLKDSLQTEEATRNVLVMPFIKNILGDDVFNPLGVLPESTAGQCINEGEKLSPNHPSQLYRYFSIADVRIAILTNGIRHQFYTDADATNQMNRGADLFTSTGGWSRNSKPCRRVT